MKKPKFCKKENLVAVIKVYKTDEKTGHHFKAKKEMSGFDLMNIKKSLVNGINEQLEKWE